MAEGNKAIVKRFYEEISKGNLDIVDEVVSDNLVEHDEFPGLEGNRDGVRKMFTQMHQAFQDFQIKAEAIFEDDDVVIARGIMKGRHKGDFLGIAPTGKQISVPFVDFIRISGGLCVEHWGVTDTGIMMQQLGRAGA